GYVMDVFKKSLQEQGIALVRANDIQFAETPEHATLLTSKQSMPLEELLIPFMKLSNNGHGEMLTKEMGKVVAGEGSWTEGLKVIQSVVTGLGVNGQTIRLRDGSGMSHQNFIPANDLTQLLFEAQQRDWFAALENSLPIAGNPERMVGGTLSNRMKNSAAQDNARAKTGSLSGVATLSGYVTSADGEPFIFSILIDHHISSEVTDIADALVIALAEHQFH
ncbi:MAG TPA: D-alanyl-D-alanine carboxypeptidase/D-alanyl-D-alanine-endopeptidase, partial [Savagea sp.]